VNEQRKNKFTWLIFQRAPANLSPAGAHNAEAQRGTTFVCCSTQGQTKQAAAYMLVGRRPSLAGNEIFTRERATCSAREKLMPSKRAEAKQVRAGGQSPFLPHAHKTRTTQQVNLDRWARGAGGRRKEMGKLLSLLAEREQKICRQIFSREAKFELEMRAKCTFCPCANGPVLRQAE
jgi:pyocin large subunit-like protein